MVSLPTLPNFTDCLRNKVCSHVKNAKKVITIAWLISLVFVLAAFIIACIAVNTLTKGGTNNTPAAFAAMWTCLVLIVISVMGTVIMRKFQAAVSIGFFLGVVFVMCNQMLILFAIFADRSTQVGESEGMTVMRAQQAMAVFSFFLFIVYGFFGSVLAIFRNDVVKQAELEVAEATLEQPYPEQEYAEEQTQYAERTGSQSPKR
mmetsp:Transcript_20155/g.19467  ORF Transcript_20155/g.19467 Transcript_20155/m.19467 type:complete len:204 (-) Transcript_20155:145-756(-)